MNSKRSCVLPDYQLSLLDSIDATRIMRQIDQLGKIGNVASTGGVTRLAFSHEDKAARELLVNFMQEAGLQIHRDPIGNIIGTLAGKRHDAPILATGSHIDVVVNGGKFDGIVGMLASIEAARVIRENAKLDANIEVICFVMEESSRFGNGYGFGSRVMVGSPVSDRELQLQDESGMTLALAIQELKAWETGEKMDFSSEIEILERTKQDILDAKRNFSGNRAFVELHIEQGPVLERDGKQVGIVTGIAAPTRLQVAFIGEQNHSGTTPMIARRDALAAAAEAILEVERVGSDNEKVGIVATVGTISVFPGAVNVIPGQAVIKIDIRGVDAQTKVQVSSELIHRIVLIGRKRNIEVQVEELANEIPVTLSERVLNASETVCSQLGIDCLRMHSGAGHDTAHLAEVTEAGLIFVRSIGGVSHDPREFSTMEDILASVKVLLGVLLLLASQPL